MKSERRHELQENELADWLDSTIEKVTPHLKTIGGVILLLAVCFGAYVIWTNRAAADQSAAWDSFYAAAGSENASEEMLRLADAQPAAPAGLWARIYVADGALAEGVQNLFTDRAVAKTKLKEAVTAYGQVAENATGKYEPLVERALYGQAKAYEALGEKSDVDEAVKLYKRIKEEFPGTVLAGDADARITILESPAAKGFYDWFAKATPAPRTTPGAGGIPGIGPAFNDANVPQPPADTTVAPNLDPFKNAPPTDQPNPPAESPTLPLETPAVPTDSGIPPADTPAPPAETPAAPQQ